MKILYLITKSEIGGAQTHVAQLVNFFVENNHEVAVMSMPGGWLENETKNSGAKFFSNNYFSNNLNPIRFFLAIKIVQKLVGEFKPDLVACHSTAAGFIGRIAIWNSIPTIYTAHGWSFEPGTPFWRRFPAVIVEKMAAHFCKKIICVSKYTRDMGLRYKIAEQGKMVMVYNGVENPITAGVKVNNRIKIISVGRLSKQKNPELLIKVTTNLPNDLINRIEVLLVGNGPKLGMVHKLVEQNKSLLIRVLPSATRDDIKKLLQKSDIFVLSTNWEGLPYSILEAMSVGLPVIATDVGGISELVDSSCGFLIKRDDGLALQRALSSLIMDNNLRFKMGENAKKIIKNRFSINQMLLETEKVYNTVLNNNL